jgi:hypothetical protein
MTAHDIVQDAQLRSVLEAADRACEQCLAILALIQDNLESKPAASCEEELSSQQKLLYSHLAVVRGLNRKAILDVRKTKQETTDARQEVDKLHLQLQNLYYEQRHFRGEITVCENYAYVQLCLSHPFLTANTSKATLTKPYHSYRPKSSSPYFLNMPIWTSTTLCSHASNTNTASV